MRPEPEFVDLSMDDDDLVPPAVPSSRRRRSSASQAGPGPSTLAAARARTGKDKQADEVEVVELSDSDDDQRWPLRPSGSGRNTGKTRTNLVSFSSVELIDDDDGDDDIIALAPPPPPAARAPPAGSSSAGRISPVKPKAEARADPERAPTSPPAAPSALEDEPAAAVGLDVPAPAAAAAVAAVDAQPADPPADPAALALDPGAEAEVDPLAAYLADIAVLLPDVLPARARAAVQALVAEGVHAQDDVVNGAIDDLLAEEEDDGMDQDAGEDGGEDVDAEGEEEEEEDADDAGPDAEAGGAVAPVDPRPPPAPPPPPTSPADDATTHLLLLLPDIDPAFARQTVDSLVAKGITSQGQIVDQAMDVFFALPKGYPKAASATGSKRKRDGDDDEDGDGEARGGKKQKVDRTDYGDVKRRRAAVVGTAQGKVYDELSIATMSEKFGLVPVPHLRKEFAKTHLFAPTYLSILKQSKLSLKPYKEKKTPTFTKGKERRGVCAEWQLENDWLRAKMSSDEAARAREIAEAEEQERLEASGMGVECGCCFGTVAFERCGSCDDGHLFCVDCIEGHAKNQIGGQVVEINCMDTSGCQAKFLEAELRRILPAKLVNLWERLQQQKHITAAGLENLEACPVCVDFRQIIDNEHEKLFQCQSDACGAVTCRKCKREEHLPRTCEEVAAEDKIDHRHAVEEAMTQALIRKCPKATCLTPTIKESGCNKMRCSSCQTMFCYICNAIINDYTHFSRDPANYSLPEDKKKCPLWDDLGERTEKELREAREKAKEELRAQGVDVDEGMDVALPDRPPPPPPRAAVPWAAQPQYIYVPPPPPPPPANARAYAGLPARPAAGQPAPALQPAAAAAYAQAHAAAVQQYAQRLAQFNALPRAYQGPAQPVAGMYGAARPNYVPPPPPARPAPAPPVAQPGPAGRRRI